MKTENRYSLLAFVALLLGLCIYVYLTNRHYDVMLGTSQGSSICNVSEKLNCDVVNTSRFSEIAGIPVAVLATTAFAIMLLFVIGIKILSAQESQTCRRWFLYLSGISSLFALFLIGIQVWIGVFCLFCLGSDLMIFLSFFSALKLNSGQPLAHLKEDLGNVVTFRHKGIASMLLAIPLLALLIHGIVKDSRARDIDKYIDQYLAEWNASPSRSLDLPDAPSKGDPQSKIKIVEFADFQCPGCRMAATTLHTFMQSHKNEVFFQFQNYPLASDCNHKIKTVVHPLACELAKAAECSKAQQKFWPVHDWLFEHQEGIKLGDLENMSKELGIDYGTLNECMKNPATLESIMAQADRGTAAGVNGTPTVYVNGKLLPGASALPILRAAVQSL